ncbi:DUF4058 family protein [Frigoriglobus tundricola]|nr:DUF4058 family protein [Frigoriglobus tundricola]
MHDWTRVDPNDYHDFHFAWIAAIRQALNTGRLPDGYFAMAEHTTPPYVPDVLTLTLPTPDGAPAVEDEPTNEHGGVATLAPPVTRVASTEHGKKRKPAGRRRVAVRHVRNRRLVAVIEIVSPSNKASKAEFADLRDKSVELLRAGVHVLLIDPFPPTPRDPKGLHDAVWRALTGKRFDPPADKPLTLAAYAAVGGNTFSAFVEPLAVGDRLADMPVFLTPQAHVAAPLEETYQSAWAGFPVPLRPLLG